MASTAPRLADAEATDLSDLVDTGRYPLHDPHGADLRAVIAQVRAALSAEGCSVLPGFVRPEALEQARREGAALATKGFFARRRTNPYFTADDPTLAADDPRRIFMERTSGFVTRDMIPADQVIHRLYVAQAMKAFVAACLGEARVYEYADPFAGLVINILPDGTQQPWHYDTNAFIVTMMTQAPEAGGEFEYCPHIRSPRDEAFDAVRAVLLDEDRAPVKTLRLRPGDLQFFMGRYSLHRVTRVHGARERHTAIFAYSEQPGVIGRVERTRQIYGRVSEAHLEAERRPMRSDSLTD